MTRYDITLRIAYEYDQPVVSARHALRMSPRHIPDRQRVIASHIELDPRPDARDTRLDFFGNSVLSAAYASPHRQLEVSLHARVQRLLPVPVLNMTPDPAGLARELRNCRVLGPDSPLHYLSDSPRVKADPRFERLAREVTGPAMSVVDVIEAIGLALKARMTFDPEATDAETSPLEALENGRGVCQDYSHIMIACLRAIGIPAGYVSGFLRTVPPPGMPRLEGSDAMHAWVRGWAGTETGWYEYDPTNGTAVGLDHIVVAYGRDYADVAPVKGVSRHAGEQQGSHSVDVVPAE